MINGGDVEALSTVTGKYSELRVADYQRNYNWERDQILDLWSDLIETAELGDDHFFGSLILEKDLTTGGRPRAEVVDGQQRLTTLMVLVSRLRDELVRIGGDDRIREGEFSFSLLDSLNGFIGLHPTGTKFIPNLLIRDEFLKILKTPDTKAAEKESEGRDIKIRSRESTAGATLNFRKAFHQLRKLVMDELLSVSKDLDEASRPEAKKQRIYQLWLAISQNFKVLTITTTSQSESLEVFLTTNDRGLDLGVMDLVRGKILSAISKRASSDAKRREVFEKQLQDLEKISNQVGSARQIDQFLRQWLHLRAETKSVNKEGVVFYQRLTMKKVPDFVEGLIRNAKDFSTTEEHKAKEIWSDITYGSSIFPRVMGESNDGINAATRLRLFALKAATKSYRILAMKVLDRKLALTKDQVENLIKELLRTVFSYTLSGGNAQELENELQKLAHTLQGADSIPDVLNGLRDWRGSRELTLDHLVDNADDESWSRALLFAIAAESNGTKALLDKYEVEHVAPQTPNDHWRTTLSLKGASYKQMISQLGNLVLLDSETNNELKQSDYATKRKEYENSHVEMTRQLAASFSNWGVKEIESRTEGLLKDLFKLLTQ